MRVAFNRDVGTDDAMNIKTEHKQGMYGQLEFVGVMVQAFEIFRAQLF